MINVPMRIDTVHFFPHRERVVIVCRGLTSTKSDTLADLDEAGFAAEWIDRPKSVEHYIEAFARQRKRGNGLKYLDDSDYVPEGNPAKKPKERLIAPGEGLNQRQIERNVVHELGEMRKLMVEQGLDTTELDKIPTHIDTSVDPDSLPEGDDEFPTDEGIKKKLAAETESFITKLRADVAKAVPAEDEGKALKQFDEIAETIRKGPAGPPTYSRRKIRDELQEQITLLRNAEFDASALQAQLDDEKLDQKMRELEAFVREAYRIQVQHQSVAPPIEKGASEPVRARVLQMVRGGEPLAEIDLTGADLSGLDLRGAKLTRAFMESCDLTGANLEGADLDFAVLARARLSGLDFSKCRKLQGANFSEAKLVGTDFTGQDLTGCYFVGADLEGTKLAKTKLDHVDFGKAIFRGTDLQRLGRRAPRVPQHEAREGRPCGT